MIDRSTLDKLDPPELGDGVPLGETVGDDRSGTYWLLVDPRLRLGIKVALITGRPLLLLGPSGTGKSSLARAISETLGWTYYEKVVTSQTRLDDLVGSVDVVRRLHVAELAGRIGDGSEFPKGLEAFIEPGVLWWAFDPKTAAGVGREDGDPRSDPGVPARTPAANPGAVVLIDEIDKAEPDVPNNLLVPLGSRRFRPEGLDYDIVPTRPHGPLICITSNKEREMPPAFLRRCVEMELPFLAPEHLVAVAQKHLPDVAPTLAQTVRKRLLPGPENTTVSTAEFIDAVRAADMIDGANDEQAPIWDDLESVLRPSAGRRRR